MPRVAPRLLEKSFAQNATNCYFDRDWLEPSKAPLDTGQTLLVGTKTIYWFNPEGNGGLGFWFEWNSDVDVVRGPIFDDPNIRTYFTGLDKPRYTTVSLGQSGTGPFPGASRELGLPVPGNFSASGMSGEPGEGFQEVETSYVITFVSDLGEESAPSFPTNTVKRWDGDLVNGVSLSGLPVASGEFVIVAKRIYRIELNGVFQFVDEVAASADTYNDVVQTDELGEPVPTEGWLPPNEAMIGLTALPNGILMGWWGNTVAFSEPFQPHAWPVQYRLALDYDVVGAAVAAQGVILATQGSPYLIAGTDPASMSVNEIDIIQACMSKRSVVDMGNYVMYASPDGLVAAGGLEAPVISEPHITPRQWRDRYKPESIQAYKWDDRYLAFYDNGVTKGAFTFRPSEGFREFTDYADAGYVDELTGDLYIKDGTSLKIWDEGPLHTYTWESKEFSIPPGRYYAVAKIDAENYPVNFEFYIDGVLAKTIAVSNRKSFRLPTTARYRDCKFKVTGSDPVNFIQLATMKSEIV